LEHPSFGKITLKSAVSHPCCSSAGVIWEKAVSRRLWEVGFLWSVCSVL
jgi:hypothetical protein